MDFQNPVVKHSAISTQHSASHGMGEAVRLWSRHFLVWNVVFQPRARVELGTGHPAECVGRFRASEVGCCLESERCAPAANLSERRPFGTQISWASIPSTGSAGLSHVAPAAWMIHHVS